MSKFSPGPYDFSGLRDKVVKLRCEGHGPTFIAKSLGVSVNTVAKILDSEFRERFRDREDLKRQTAMQLDALARPLFKRWDEASIDRKDRRDAELVLKILEQKRRLFGLDEAVKVDVTHKVEEMDDAALEAELKRIGYNPTPQLPPASPPLPAEQIEDADFTRLPTDEGATPEDDEHAS